MNADASPAVAELVVADTPAAWRSAGFSVDPDGVCRVGGVRIRLVGRGSGLGLVAWTLRGDHDGTHEGTDDGAVDGAVDLDGVPTRWTDQAAPAPGLHPNGVTRIDHVVLLSPDVDRTLAALAAIGVAPRRERIGELGGRPVRQVFLRLGEVIVEVVGSPSDSSGGPSSLWGITHTVADIDATAAFLGARTSPVKAAVQPGRRITTLRHRDFDLSVRTALISAAAARP